MQGCLWSPSEELLIETGEEDNRDTLAGMIQRRLWRELGDKEPEMKAEGQFSGGAFSRS
jgi:hypothetical protein